MFYTYIDTGFNSDFAIKSARGRLKRDEISKNVIQLSVSKGHYVE